MGSHGWGGCLFSDLDAWPPLMDRWWKYFRYQKVNNFNAQVRHVSIYEERYARGKVTKPDTRLFNEVFLSLKLFRVSFMQVDRTSGGGQLRRLLGLSQLIAWICIGNFLTTPDFLESLVTALDWSEIRPWKGSPCSKADKHRHVCQIPLFAKRRRLVLSRSFVRSFFPFSAWPWATGRETDPLKDPTSSPLGEPLMLAWMEECTTSCTCTYVVYSVGKCVFATSEGGGT